MLARRDVLGIAQTGTGKTAAFVLPMLTMLAQGRARGRMPRTLILDPRPAGVSRVMNVVTTTTYGNRPRAFQGPRALKDPGLKDPGLKGVAPVRSGMVTCPGGSG